MLSKQKYLPKHIIQNFHSNFFFKKKNLFLTSHYCHISRLVSTMRQKILFSFVVLTFDFSLKVLSYLQELHCLGILYLRNFFLNTLAFDNLYTFYAFIPFLLSLHFIGQCYIHVSHVFAFCQLPYIIFIFIFIC